jgi:uncharacterized protein YbbC (DUF1343 family)
MNHHVTIGLEACLEQPPAELLGAKFGLLANQASVDSAFRYAWDVLAERFSGQLAALFSPQHGLWCEQQANMIETAHAFHPRLRIPIHSLYHESRKPTREMLDGLDAFVIDLQDVGTRVYTFIWTASYCLEACAERGLPVIVLDRPNPLGGRIVEGPLLEPAQKSFVGRAAIPMRHGLTMGELVRFVNDDLGIGAQVHVVSLRNWSRDMPFDDTGRVWVAPSPNLARLEAVRAYPGQVLLEGTNLSEGRGTTTPFEICGAPFIDGERLAARLAECRLPGIVFRPVRFLPTFDKWAGTSCGGVFLHVVDAASFRPYRTSVAILAAVHELWPHDFAWLPPPYEYETIQPPIDILTGSPRLRDAISAGDDLDIVFEHCCDTVGWPGSSKPSPRNGRRNLLGTSFGRPQRPDRPPSDK